MRLAEVLRGGELHYGLDVALEEHRQYDQRDRLDRTQSRTDRHVIARNFGEQNAALLHEALTDEAFARVELRAAADLRRESA